LIGLDFLLQRWRQLVHKAGNCLEEAGVGHHRRQHGPHADVGIGLADGRQPFRRRHGKLGRQVIGRSAALHHHLGRADQARKIFVLEGARAAHIGTRGQQKLQGHAIDHALGKVAVAVGVAVDQAGMQQLALGVDHRGRIWRRDLRPDLDDRVALHQDVGLGCGMALDVDQAASADHRHRCFRRFRHVTLSPYAIDQAPGVVLLLDHGKKIRSAATTIWNRTTPITDRMIRAPNATGTLKNAVDVWIRKPSPASALTNSATTAPTTASEIDTFSPAKMNGIA
jgi:hypothetical protein